MIKKFNIVKGVNGIIDHKIIGKSYGKKYLGTYFSKIDKDELEICKFIVRHYSKIKSGAKFLDIGCGPGIQHIIPVANYVSEIVMADFLQNNLNEIKSWKIKDKNSHKWDFLTEVVLKMEKTEIDKSSINKRENLLRKKIVAFRKVDILDSKSLSFKKHFDAIGFFYCAEAAATRKLEWAQGIKNVTDLLLPGGWVFMSSCRNSKFYTLKNVDGTIDKISVACVNESDFLKLFKKLGFNMKNIVIETRKVGMDNEGISDIVLIAAQKML